MINIILTVKNEHGTTEETYTSQSSIPHNVLAATDMYWSDVKTVEQAETLGKALIKWFNATRRSGKFREPKRTFISARIEEQQPNVNKKKMRRKK